MVPLDRWVVVNKVAPSFWLSSDFKIDLLEPIATLFKLKVKQASRPALHVSGGSITKFRIISECD
jgi:hypothetical protein